MSTNTPEMERRRLWPFEEHGQNRAGGECVVYSCACLDHNATHCSLIRDALVTGDDCFRPRRCECGCHQIKP